MRKSTKFSPEVRERAVRMVLEHQGEHASQWAAIGSIAAKIGCTAETLRALGAPGGARPGPAAAGLTTRGARADQGAGARGARAAPGQRDPAQGVGVFCPGGARPPVQAMMAFIDEHRDAYGVEPICKVLPIAPSTYYAHAARQRRPGNALVPGRSARRRCASRSGASGRRTSRSTASRKVWRQLRREGIARGPLHGRAADAAAWACGAWCAARRVRTTISDPAAPCPLRSGATGSSGRQRPNAAVGLGLHLRRDLAGLRVRGLRHRRLRPAHRRLAGVSARCARTSCSMRWSRRCTTRPSERRRAVHHTDRGSQYVVDPLHRAPGRGRHRALGRQRRRQLRQRAGRDDQRPVQGRGDPPPGPWRTREAVEFATLEWVAGSTTGACSSRSATSRPPRPKQLLSPTGRAGHGRPDSNQPASGKPGAVQLLGRRQQRRRPQAPQARRRGSTWRTQSTEEGGIFR